MSTIVPNPKLGKVEFYENHNPTWTTNAAAIGTTTAEVAALTAKTTAARAAYNAQQLAKDQAKAATRAFNDAVAEMASTGSDILKKIKAKAAVDGDAVYDLALIPSPSEPHPIGPPGPATDFTATLDPTGVLNLAWKSVNPAGATGTIYQVSRQLDATGGMVIIGAAGDRKFADPTVPAGTAQVTYRIMPLRSTIAGPAREFTVKFGVSSSGGALMATVVEPQKTAA